MSSTAVTLAIVTRSGKVECEHFGHVALCDAAGNVIFSAGDPEHLTYMRSSAKPLQAVTCLALGAAERFDWTERELAIVCASHSAEPMHQELVRSILAKAGLAAEDLQCGPHPPIDAAENERLIRAGLAPGRVHSNCSGKHAGMLAACRAAGWPIESYREPQHPLQLANVRTLSRFAGIRESGIKSGVDGCGVPSFFVSLRAMATAFARLAGPDGQSADDRALAGRVVAAMTAWPELIAGAGRFDTQLGQFAGKQIVCKGGAEGVWCAGIVGEGLGLALKISDGGSRAIPAIACGGLKNHVADLDWNAFAASANRPTRNTRGEIVGDIRTTLE